MVLVRVFFNNILIWVDYNKEVIVENFFTRLIIIFCLILA
jgi:hypothetical protein